MQEDNFNLIETVEGWCKKYEKWIFALTGVYFLVSPILQFGQIDANLAYVLAGFGLLVLGYRFVYVPLVTKIRFQKNARFQWRRELLNGPAHFHAKELFKLLGKEGDTAKPDMKLKLLLKQVCILITFDFSQAERSVTEVNNLLTQLRQGYPQIERVWVQYDGKEVTLWAVSMKWRYQISVLLTDADRMRLDQE